MRFGSGQRGRRGLALPSFVFLLVSGIGCFPNYEPPSGPVWYHFPGQYQLKSFDGRPLNDTLTLPDGSGPPAVFTIYDGMVDVNVVNTTFLILVKRGSEFEATERTGSFVATQKHDSLFVMNKRLMYVRGDTLVFDSGGTDFENTLGAHQWRFLKAGF
jgi:hypothetical protein